jgi:formamidopyrimidine-DNA glycosylase
VPELIEVETYRRQAAATVGRVVADVIAPDSWYLKDTSGDELAQVLPGRTVEAARRIGKLLILDLSGEVRLGLRFGMTGRLVVDGDAAIAELLYSTTRDEPTWSRFGLRFKPDGDLVIRDPRRLGGVSLEPDETHLGPDAATVTPEQLAGALQGAVALKARLLDQSRLAGLGNLLVDEILWRASLDPARPAGSLEPSNVQTLSVVIRTTVVELSDRGGSHTGDLQPARVAGALCPRDGAPLQRRKIGGRTTISCPRHQR